MTTQELLSGTIHDLDFPRPDEGETLVRKKMDIAMMIGNQVGIGALNPIDDRNTRLRIMEALDWIEAASNDDIDGLWKNH